MWPSSFLVPPESFQPSLESFQPKPPDRIRQEVLLKLRWSILGSLENISIQTGINEDGTEECQPFLAHPLAMESLAIPPVSRLQLDATDIAEAKHFRLVSEGYAYERLVIKNEDRSPITIKDFVTQAHHYLSQHKDVLVHYRKNVGFSTPPPPGEAVGPGFAVYDPMKKHDLFFKHASSNAYSEDCRVSISTAMEGEGGKSAEAFWRSQRATATSIASYRASLQG
ncbi:hypothetical protein HBI56_205020 [Parastagonospora nodorum]|nr:hypothetical protein HBI10_124350 [Parastagonospora nodorum]KAH4024276.1 hypothetical protein HBI13_085180 [Parastagonospora nodorum]KAH4222725.1 hypothetical protein HBI06_138090 [Parastagonospora nodorum]KAH4240632.1 hypothetical protein HBI05_110650 [Parastagonospora nodorum]KAH4346628.1 hypothetical protein HBH98_107410 [Parastagonospora nodorum]